MIKKLVSVIVPVYNSELVIENCVESLLQQTYPEIEILLIDDGSTDKSSHICNNFLKRDSRVKVYHKYNGGASSARNVGLEMAEGEFITFVDSDDVVALNMIEIMLNNLLTENADISEIDFKVSDDFYKRKKRKGYYRVFQNNKSLKEFFSGNKVENVVWGKLYKKSIIGDLRFNEKYKIGEDLLFNFQILNKEHRIVVDTRRSLYTYRIEEKSIMNQQFNKNTLDFIDIFNEIHQDSPTELFNYVEAKFVREKIKCLRKMFELGEIADENLRLQRYKFWQDIKSYSICKAIRFLSKKHICTLYLMKYFPYVYIKMYNKFQKQ